MLLLSVLYLLYRERNSVSGAVGAAAGSTAHTQLRDLPSDIKTTCLGCFENWSAVCTCGRLMSLSTYESDILLPTSHTHARPQSIGA